jgi:hypothetical protein
LRALAKEHCLPILGWKGPPLAFVPFLDGVASGTRLSAGDRQHVATVLSAWKSLESTKAPREATELLVAMLTEWEARGGVLGELALICIGLLEPSAELDAVVVRALAREGSGERWAAACGLALGYDGAIPAQSIEALLGSERVEDRCWAARALERMQPGSPIVRAAVQTLGREDGFIGRDFAVYTSAYYGWSLEGSTRRALVLDPVPVLRDLARSRALADGTARSVL